MRVIAYFILVSFIFLQACTNKKHTYHGYVVGTNTYISTQYEGILKKLAIKRGDKVTKGSLLYVLDAKPDIYLLNEAIANLNENISQLIDLQKPKRTQDLDIIRYKIKQVDAQINLAQLRENRNQTLFVKKVLAKDALDFSHEHLNELLAKKKQLAAELELANLGARPDIINAKKSFIKSLQVKIKNLSWVVTSKTAYSPDTGFVYDTYYLENELVTKARPVVALLFTKDIDLEFFVPYSWAKKLSIGKKIEYSLMGDEKNLKSATVIYISSEAEYVPPLVYSKDNTDKIVFKIKAKPASDENLTPGLPITIKFDA